MSPWPLDNPAYVHTPADDPAHVPAPADVHTDVHTVYLGLGGNLGDRAAMLAAAIERLAAVMTIDAASSIYETEPVGYADQGPFLNQVVRAHTDLSPRDVLRAIKGIERALGRPAVDPIRFGPRFIDIDLLLYDDWRLDEPGGGSGGVEDRPLVVPHPRLHERAFVLVPLAEIAPELDVPGLGRVSGLLGRVDATGLERIAP